MANNCINHISFRGTEDAVERFKEFHQTTRENQTTDHYSWNDMSSDRGVELQGEIEDNRFVCLSPWSPPLDLLIALASEFNLEFCIQYEELGSYAFGVAIIKINETDEVYLTEEEIKSFEDVNGDINSDDMETYLLKEAKSSGLDIF